jgi:hypothetical protein
MHIITKNADYSSLLSVSDLITESVYSEKAIINESFTTTLPSFI